MALTLGLSLSCTDAIAAGLKNIYIIDKSDVTSMTLASGSVSNYETITLASGKHFYEYDFEEDQAEFRETTEGERGSYKVTHEIEFYVKGLAQAKRDALQELIDNSVCGFVVAVKDSNDVVWIIGYSEEFTTTRAATISGMENKTLKALGEIPGATVTLRAVDTQMARYATAAIVTS